MSKRTTMTPPPGTNGCRYNGVYVDADGSVEVLEQDVAALEDAGWSIAKPPAEPMTSSAPDALKESTDDTGS